MYLNLRNLIRWMASDNDMSVRSDIKYPPNAERLEELASDLSDIEQYCLICGEEEQVEHLIEMYELYELDNWLCSIFDGDAHTDVFEVPPPYNTNI